MCRDRISISDILLLPCALCLYGSVSSGQVLIMYVVLPYTVLDRVASLDRDVSCDSFCVDQSDIYVLLVLHVVPFVVVPPLFPWWSPVVLSSSPSSPSIDVLSPR